MKNVLVHSSESTGYCCHYITTARVYIRVHTHSTPPSVVAFDAMH